jgi:hypothetical protein
VKPAPPVSRPETVSRRTQPESAQQILGKAGKPSKIAPGSEAILAELGDQVQHPPGDAPSV